MATEDDRATETFATLVFVDGCAVNRFALLNVDPLLALAGSGFAVALTDDLAAEYARVLDHLFVPPYVKALARKLLAGAVRVEIPWGGATDIRLARLSRASIVISDDRALLRAGHAGMVPYADVEAHWRAGHAIADLLRERAAGLAPQARNSAAGERSAIVG